VPALKTRILAILPISLALGACGQPAPTDAPQQARNVILFIGDGMGVTTVTAARIFDGQSKGLKGEEHWLSFERFPDVALVKTWNSNQQVPDSAGTATAMLTGSKTRAGVINIGPEPRRGDCRASESRSLTSLASEASRRGLATGVVTTARLTHATPATMYATSPERNWESDRRMPEDARADGCLDIASQLVEDSNAAALAVAMGGGARGFFGAGAGGERLDANADLPGDWVSAAPGRRFVTTAAELATVAPGETVLGLFARSHMTYMAERTDESTEPTLTEMTTRAIDLLAQNPQGYFLMVEGGRIDHAHHDGRPGYAMLETQEFNRAVEAALQRVDLDETLVLVTADHSHVFTMGGYPTRGNPILGLVVNNDSRGEPLDEPALAADGQPYTTLGYYNGPGAIRELPRKMPETGIDAVAQSLIPVQWLEEDGSWSYDESHGGEDVALYGTGPGSERVRGVIEQDRIHDIMRAALGFDD